MNVLYIASIFPTPKEGSNLYTDLAEELNKQGNNVTVLVAEEKKNIQDTQINKERNVEVIRVKTGNLYNVNMYEKAISFITLQNKLKKAIDKYLSNRKFDMVLFMAPPVTIYSVIKYAMEKFNCISYLMQKDIFPQNAIDLEIITKSNPAYWYFRNKEIKLYKTATIIGCMSYENKKYLLDNNKFLKEQKVQIFPNTININKNKLIINQSIRKKYNIPDNKVIALYGGNFGKPQGINFLIQVLEKYKNNSMVEFILCGKGTEKQNVVDYVEKHSIKNVIFFDFMNRKEYINILIQADIGLVFLDYRFKVPNIPSKTLSYFEYNIPIMAATDKNTDYKILLEQSKAGLWAESNNIEDFSKKFDYLIKNKNSRIEMGNNGRKYLEKNLTTDISVKILEKAFNDFKEDKNV